MILSFAVYLILFVGGIALMGIAHGLPMEWQAVTFVAGLLILCLSLAFIMRQGGTATRRSNNWDGGPGAV